MDELLSFLSQTTQRATESGAWLSGATALFSTWGLVAARLAGLTLLGPLFGHPQIPHRVRAMLVLAISFVVTPAIIATNSEAFANAYSAIQYPFEFVGLLGLEVGVGFALGLGISLLLSGLQLAGSMIDQQLGTSVGTVFNPQLQTEVTLSGEMLHQVGIVVFLVAGGHHPLLSTLVDSFHAVPIGAAWISTDLIDLLSDFVHQSFALAIKVAAPVTATMALVSLGMGMLGRSLPSLNVMIVSFPIRSLLGLFIVGLALPSIAELLAESLPNGIEQLRQALSIQIE